MTLPKVALSPSSTSFYSPGEGNLDPRLFDDQQKMLKDTRAELLRHYERKMGEKYSNPMGWSHVWLAGSGASFQWKAQRDPADLDMLVGVDYPEFRYHNRKMAGLTDTEISWVLNTHMRKNLNMPSWRGTHEVTWYNNPQSKDIKDLNPYAAYSLTDDDWHVRPTMQEAPPQYNPDAFGDVTKAQDILNRYTRARTALTRSDLRPELRRAHASSISAALEQGHALFEDIHSSRGKAFLPNGKGYSDPANVRWQTGKASGVVPALRALSEVYLSRKTEQQMALYGTTFPDVNTLLIQAMVMDDR